VIKGIHAVAVLLLTATSITAQPLPTLDIRVSGLSTMDSTFVLRTSGLTIGDVHSSSDLADAVKRLYRAGIAEDVQIFETNVLEGRVLSIRIVERPPLGDIQFEGNDHFSEEDLQKTVPLIKGQRVSRGRIDGYCTLIKDAYKNDGYLKSLVVADVSEAENARNVVFRINEGPKVVVREIRILGAEAFEPDKIRGQMKLKPKGFLRSGKYDREKLEESLNKIELFYRKHGYIDAVVIDNYLQYLPDGKSVAVIVEVDEGDLSRFGELTIEVEDSLSFPVRFLEERIDLAPGEPFNYDKFEEGIRSIYEIFQEDGYLWSRIIPEESRRDSVIDYTLSIRQGPPAIVRLINISGNTRTKEKVIRRELVVFPGDRFRRSALIRSHREIYNLGFFEDVMIDFANPSTEGEVDFDVAVKEKSSGQFNFGVTYSSQSKLMGFVQLAHPNVLGNGWKANIRWEFGKYSNNIEFGFTEPWLFDTPTRAGFDVYNTKNNIYYADYSYRRRGGGFHVARPLPWFDYVSAYFAYALNDIKVDPDSDYDGPELTEGWQTTSRTVYRLVRDSRDNFLDTRSGSRSVASLELAGRLLGGDIAYDKFEVETSWYTPLSSFLILNLHLKGGTVAGHPSLNDIPVYELFRLGGTSTDGVVRGYDDYSLGPQEPSGYTTGGRSMAVMNAELRIPLVPEQIDLIGFFDAGNSWRSLGRLNLEELYRGAGVGVRINTGVMGIIGLDYGYGFDGDEPGWKPHFQFGTLM